ncbi:hypothetical protein BH09BAC6_BH09BAC6_20940 [soil metagenome]
MAPKKQLDNVIELKTKSFRSRFNPLNRAAKERVNDPLRGGNVRVSKLCERHQRKCIGVLTHPADATLGDPLHKCKEGWKILNNNISHRSKKLLFQVSFDLLPLLNKANINLPVNCFNRIGFDGIFFIGEALPGCQRKCIFMKGAGNFWLTTGTRTADHPPGKHHLLLMRA